MKVINNSEQWYSLFCVKGLGAKRLHSIYSVLTELQIGVDRLFQMEWPEFQRLFPKLGKPLFESIHKSNADKSKVDWQRLIDMGVKVVHLGHEYYPNILLQRLQDDAPPVLFCKGYLGLLKSDGVAIVGSRNAAATGLALASQFAAELALEGKNVISGYAKGVDTMAHLGSLEKDGTTTVVLSSGILDFSRKREFENVRWEGNVLAVSQFHPSERWSGRNAMTRNKLICALSKAVIIIEAGEEKDNNGKMSGTFNSGKTALQMGVPLFVVSPRVFNNKPRGNSVLIEKGGIEVDAENAASSILKYIGKITSPLTEYDEAEQLSMF